MDKKTKAAYRNYYRSEVTFREEIEDEIGVVPGMAEIRLADAENSGSDIEKDEENDLFDDTDVPLSRFVNEAVGVDITGHSENTCFCITADSVVQEDNGMLRAGGLEENIWAYRGDGTSWSEVLAEFNTQL